MERHFSSRGEARAEAVAAKMNASRQKASADHPISRTQCARSMAVTSFRTWSCDETAEKYCGETDRVDVTPNRRVPDCTAGITERTLDALCGGAANDEAMG